MNVEDFEKDISNADLPLQDGEVPVLVNQTKIRKQNLIQNNTNGYVFIVFFLENIKHFFNAKKLNNFLCFVKIKLMIHLF